MEIEIAGRKIGDGHPAFFIAEAGVNHNGSVKLGKQLIDVAVDAGVDASAAACDGSNAEFVEAEKARI